MLHPRQWYATLDAYSPDKIQFFNQNEVFKMSVDKDGFGELADGVSVKISRSGFNIQSPFDSTLDANIFLTEPKKWAIIDTDDCGICTDGKYVFDETSRRTGHYEFKGLVVYTNINQSVWLKP